MLSKEKVYLHFLNLLNQKISFLQQGLNDLRDTAANETKRTAGDKHETALAMVQLEQENISRQLTELLQQKSSYERIDLSKLPIVAGFGSLVKTNREYFFISIAGGKAIIDGNLVIALSPQSPLGAKLIGLKHDETFNINGKEYQVNEIS
jgi:transcription elongation GreA/GreB family factor